MSDIEVEKSKSHRIERDVSRSPRRYRSISRERKNGNNRSDSYSKRRHRSISSSRSYSRDRSNSRRRRSRSREEHDRRYKAKYSDDPKPCRCLGVFGLSLHTRERDLRDLFRKSGTIEDCTIVYDRRTNRSRGFGFVRFKHQEDADEARDAMNGIEFEGRKIRVDYSVTQKPHSPTPGIYMGKQRDGGRYSRYDSESRDRRRDSRQRSFSPRRGDSRSRSRSLSYSRRH